jgi:hypothetical protein
MVLGNQDHASLTASLIAGVSNYDIDPKAPLGTEQPVVRFFRATNSTGGRNIRIYKGDGSSTESHRLNGGGAAQFGLDNVGNLAVGTSAGGLFNNSHLQIGPVHIWWDGTTLRAKNGTPSSAADGSALF